MSNAAHLRFFNALNDNGAVRLYVGGHLYESGGDASIENGDSPQYGNVPSGTVSLIVNKYSDQNTGTNSSTLASLTSQTLLQDRNYTAVALLSGTTKSLVLYADNVAITDNIAYFRIINANNTTTPLYIDVVDKATGSSVYSTSSTTGFASGATTGLQQNYYGDTSGVDSEDVTIHVYSDSAMTNEIATQTVGLSVGKVVTTFIYNKKSGSGLSFRSSTDQDTNVTATTTSTTGTAGDTAGTAGDTSGTTASSTAGTTAL